MLYSAAKRFSSAISFAFALIVLSIFFTPGYGFADQYSCYFFYNPKAPLEFIESANLSDLARLEGQWFEIAIPRVDGNEITFEYKRVSKWQQVEESFEGVDIFYRSIATTKMEQYVKGFKDITRFFKSVARYQNASMKARIKDITSLKNKIIDRAKAYAAEGTFFTFERLDDFIGVRLMLNYDSKLLVTIKDPRAKLTPAIYKYFAKELGFGDNVSAIEKIDFKGDPADIEKEKYYKAAHVTVRMPDGIPVEVQLMSKNTAIWHQWDHPKVYKSEHAFGVEKVRLKVYSQFWIRLINSLEDLKSGTGSVDQVKALLGEYDLTNKSKGNSLIESTQWFLSIDEVIANRLNIQSGDRFLGLTSVLSEFTQRLLFRELSVPVIP